MPDDVRPDGANAPAPAGDIPTGAATPPADPQPAAALLAEVYDALRALARERLRGERADHTLQATALVHEAYVRLAGRGAVWADRSHFFHAAAAAMRHILTDYARARGRVKRGDGAPKVSLDLAGVADLAAAAAGDADQADQILALEEATRRLEERDPDAARVLQLRFYAGLTIADTARALGISDRQVKREWAYARAFLARELDAGP